MNSHYKNKHKREYEKQELFIKTFFNHNEKDKIRLVDNKYLIDYTFYTKQDLQSYYIDMASRFDNRYILSLKELIEKLI